MRSKHLIMLMLTDIIWWNNGEWSSRKIVRECSNETVTVSYACSFNKRDVWLCGRSSKNYEIISPQFPTLLRAQVFVLLLLKVNISKLFSLGHFSPALKNRFGATLISIESKLFEQDWTVSKHFEKNCFKWGTFRHRKHIGSALL